MSSPYPLPDPAICERARLARDARFDGVFFTAVRSTGIYCRPVCPAPAPKPRNVSYYPSAAAASAAGYRPCLRCRPELSPQAQQPAGDEAVQRALALIGEGTLQEESVETLAAEVGLGARQLQRRFLQHLGATPAQVHATRRLLLAKQLLTETALPVTQVALAAGFNSLRRFNAAFLEGCGMPPSALRRQREEVAGGELTLRSGYRPPLDLAAMLGFCSGARSSAWSGSTRTAIRGWWDRRKPPRWCTQALSAIEQQYDGERRASGSFGVTSTEEPDTSCAAAGADAALYRAKAASAAIA